ncbi:DUF1570 domain-containing protein [Lignipirellula cremea]|uniref:DUF1570 domain-containing protein n=1 Tax=Lignipirellula cremea TaxID=2528010 RepID=A0A518DUF7_9BACT|nr:DUF1570 domain-containing protein [Lignipirellula cremea]QDU95471.1 hypothetical protein Pla8534_32860 [Lignipirellula cremea]
MDIRRPLRLFSFLVAWSGLAWAGACGGSALQAADWMMQLSVDGRMVEGKVLVAQKDEVVMLLRDGEIVRFPPQKASDYRKTQSRFQAWSQSEMRGQLLREFGRGFEVSGAGNYLVVHPAGQRNLWAARFEELSRSFAMYFSARGFPLQQAPFPLVAIIFPTHGDFARAAARSGIQVSQGVLGFYSPTSNRILMYDVTAGNATASAWYINAETVIHEAVHQTAFNTGVHNRLAPQPRWLVEGLGTLFEAPGVWNSRAFPKRSDRINKYRLEAYRKYAAGRREADAIAGLVSDDRLFQTDPEGAYAEAWALTFYLSENQPRKYAELLERAASRPDFKPYTGAERLRDFQSIFGTNLPLLDAQMQRFMATLR